MLTYRLIHILAVWISALLVGYITTQLCIFHMLVVWFVAHA
jgi:hypothetical protein